MSDQERLDFNRELFDESVRKIAGMSLSEQTVKCPICDEVERLRAEIERLRGEKDTLADVSKAMIATRDAEIERLRGEIERLRKNVIERNVLK